MTTTIKVRKAEVKDLVAVSFPEYTGRKFKVVLEETVWVDRVGGGGSKAEVIAVTHDGERWLAQSPVLSTLQAPCGYLSTRPDVILVTREMFCGQDVGLTFHVHPQSPYLPKMLPAD